MITITTDRRGGGARATAQHLRNVGHADALAGSCHHPCLAGLRHDNVLRSRRSARHVQLQQPMCDRDQLDVLQTGALPYGKVRSNRPNDSSPSTIAARPGRSASASHPA